MKMHEITLNNLPFVRLTKTQQKYFVNISEPLYKKSLALNCFLNVETQNKLARDENLAVRCALAMNKNLDFKIQKKLANDEYYLVRATLAENQYIDKKIQHFLVKDENFTVLLSLTQNKKLDTKLFEFFSKHDWFLRAAICDHSKIPIKILKKLTRDENKHVREQAQKFLQKKLNKFNLQKE